MVDARGRLERFKGGLVANSGGTYAAKGKLKLRLLFTASGTINGRPGTFNNNSRSSRWMYFYITTDLTKEPMKIIWQQTV